VPKKLSIMRLSQTNHYVAMQALYPFESDLYLPQFCLTLPEASLVRVRGCCAIALGWLISTLIRSIVV
jgi:hypothetical protein